MAEILCGVVSGSESSNDACEPRSRAARRRRMEIRRFRIVSGVATPELARKRQRLDSSLVKSPLDPNTGSHPVVSDPVPSDGCPGFGLSSVCGRRREMEDSISIRPSFCQYLPEHHYFGVFDGHGCSHVAVTCKDRLHEVIAEELRGVGGEVTAVSESEWKKVSERSFARVDAEVVSSDGAERDPNCRCELQSLKSSDHAGSTAVVAVVSPGRVVVANCGDSRAVLFRGGAAVPLSSDQKPDRPDELQRIEAAGGRVIYWDGARVLGVLAMSRAIGDNHLKPFVTAEPEVTVTERADEDECLILATDGLWDVVSNEMACEVARMCLQGTTPGSGNETTMEELEEGRGKQGGSQKACINAAMLLTKLALARRSADNVTVVVVDLRRRKKRLAVKST